MIGRPIMGRRARLRRYARPGPSTTTRS